MPITAIRPRNTTSRVLAVKPISFDSIPNNFARNTGQRWNTQFCFEIHLTVRKMLSAGWIESPPLKVFFAFDLSYNHNNVDDSCSAVEVAREISYVITLCREVHGSESNDRRVVKELRGAENCVVDLEAEFPGIYREIWGDIGRRVATLAVRERPHVVYVVVEAFTVTGTENLDRKREAAVERLLKNYFSC